MIRFIPHEKLDREAWDRCLEQAANAVPYAFTWYLDRAHPGWHALVEDDYLTVMPLTGSRKYGISYLHTPYFVQQLGVISKHSPDPSLVKAFLDSIPEKYRYIDLNLNHANACEPARGMLMERMDLVLPLGRPYEEIRSGYHENTRRNLEHDRAREMECREVPPGEIVGLFRRGSHAGSYPPRSFPVIKHIMEEAMSGEMGISTGVYSAGAGLVAAAFFLRSAGRLIFLFSGNSREGYASSAMFFLIDRVIRDHAGEKLLLDFEGSDNENLARFYRGFGASAQPYYKFYLNRLSRPWNWVKK